MSLSDWPVQDEDGGDGGPEDGAQPAAAQAHLQPSSDTQEVLMWPSPGLGPPVPDQRGCHHVIMDKWVYYDPDPPVSGVLSQPLPRQLVVIKMESKERRYQDQAPL